MATIDVDFDVFKALTLKRSCEEESYNDVLRDLLGLDPVAERATSGKAGDGCIFLGVHFPEGTKFRVLYKGTTHTAEIKDGRWVGSDSKVRTSPSDAARAITGNNVNGWRFWKVKRPKDLVFQPMEKLR